MSSETCPKNQEQMLQEPWTISLEVGRVMENVENGIATTVLALPGHFAVP